MTLVRGSTDRLRLDWSSLHEAHGPDGTRYMVQTEHVRGEGVAHYAIILPPGVSPVAYSTPPPPDCPYGYESTVRDQKRVCEFDAWHRAGRPTS